MKIENIEIDFVPEIEEFCSTDLQFDKKSDQLLAIQDFLESHLLNALHSTRSRIPNEVLQRIQDQKNTKTLSQVFKDKYGVCLEWCVVAHTVLQKLGIESVFRTALIAGAPGHCYLDVKIDGWWQIFDPFAIKYIKDIGATGDRFQSGYYRESFVYK